MKKTTLYILSFLLLAFTSCDDKATEGLSIELPIPQLVTPTVSANLIEFQGQTIEVIDLGGTYTEPGAKVYEILNGDSTQIADAQVDGTVNTAIPGYYKVTYSSTTENEYGDVFHRSAERKVVVLDPNDNITGIYTSAVNRNGEFKFAEDKGVEILIVSLGDNAYSTTDWNGGYYHQYVGYGPVYAFPGKLSLDAEGNITHLTSGDPWGGSGDVLEGAVYDAGKSQFRYTYSWSYGYDFEVVLTKK